MQKIITVIGATAIGKSDFAVRLAKKFNGEIISADSRQVYRKLNLTTGKVTSDEMSGVKHHLIDILDVGEPYSVYNFVGDAKKCIDEIVSRGSVPIICGGTGLYTRALVEGFNLESDGTQNVNRKTELEQKTVEELQEIIKQNKINIVETDIKNKRRLISTILKHEAGVEKTPNKQHYQVLQICLTCEREILRERIKQRMKKRIDAGMIDEIKNVIAGGGDVEFLKNLGLDIKYAVMYALGEFNTFDEFFEKAYIADCQYAKRQVTWFKKEKNCVYLDVLDAKSFDVACGEIERFLKI